MRHLVVLFGWVFASCAILSCGGGSKVIQKVGPEDMLARGERALEKGNELLAIETLTRITVDYPGVAFIDRVVFLLGRAHLEARAYAEAEAEFQRIEKDYPFSEYADDALFLIGECYFRQRGTPQHDPTLAESAVHKFEVFLREYPDSPLAAEAAARIEELRAFLAEKLLLNAQQYYRHHRYRASVIYLTSMLDKYPECPAKPAALLLLARANEKLGNLEQACEALSRLEALGPSPSREREEATQLRADWKCAVTSRAPVEPQAGN
jgi:outer membrane protein assembly factor BamD